MCSSALPHAQLENAAHAEPLALAAATGTVAQVPPEITASPLFPMGLSRRSLWPPPGQGGYLASPR
eukprot:7301201-Alexandrium_andersonii.AAC.1